MWRICTSANVLFFFSFLHLGRLAIISSRNANTCRNVRVYFLTMEISSFVLNKEHSWKSNSFLHRCLIGDKGWFYFENLKRKNSWVDPVIFSILSTARPTRFGRKQYIYKKSMLCCYLPKKFNQFQLVTWPTSWQSIKIYTTRSYTWNPFIHPYRKTASQCIWMMQLDNPGSSGLLITLE